LLAQYKHGKNIWQLGHTHRGETAARDNGLISVWLFYRNSVAMTQQSA
jgi:hypothetical protein